MCSEVVKRREAAKGTLQLCNKNYKFKKIIKNHLAARWMAMPMDSVIPHTTRIQLMQNVLK